jgi:tetratricopeptide (TPR) repeat protein
MPLSSLYHTLVKVSSELTMLDTGRIPLIGEPLSWFRQGVACASAGDLELAVNYYNQVIEIRPDFWEAWYERGLVLESLGLYVEAIASYDRALVTSSRSAANVEIRYHRANALQYGLGEYEVAINCYDQVIQVKPTHALAWLHRGNAQLYGLKQPEAALHSYEQSLWNNPEDAIAWRNRGTALVELAHYPEAITAYDRALQIQPDDQVARQARRQALQQSGAQDLPATTRSDGSPEDTLFGAELRTDLRADLRAELRTEIGAESELGPDTLAVSHQPDSRQTQTTRLPAYELAAGALQPMLLLQDDIGQREIPLSGPEYTVGRDPQNSICLRSQFVSRFHAVLQRLDRPDGSYTYRLLDGDLRGKPSTNGVQVNGHKQLRWDLKPGDCIVFGPKVQATYRMPHSSG